MQGSQGYQGYTGPTGMQGSQGYQGYTGPTGMQGSQGYQGYTGPTGMQGSQGYQGYTGPTGMQGSIGTQGFQGSTGPSGTIPANIVCTTVTASGQISALSYVTTSDYRIKENIIPLDNYFKVDYLNPVTYVNKQTNKQDIGLIAHELQEHFPELVNGVKDGPDTQSVNYNGLIPILIHEIKILKTKMNNLEKQLQDKGIL
jgi:hypothetical protein